MGQRVFAFWPIVGEKTMMEDIKIIKVPRAENMNSIAFATIYNRYRACPFCNQDGMMTDSRTDEWYGTKDRKFLTLFKEKHHWKKFIFTCNICGAKWESPPFRADYPDDVPYVFKEDRNE